MTSYDTAQICLNGHVINGSFYSSPEFSKEFCTSCGKKTITICPKCNCNIRGDYKEGFSSMSTPPSYCHNCGSAYPWTISSLESAKELLILENILSQEELDYFNENMVSILVDTPKTNIVATKLKIFISKAGNIVASSLRDLVVDIGSETTKKIILGE